MTASPSSFRLGFGATGAWGKQWFSPGKAKDLVSYALQLGVRHFDTAGFYANGLAETRLGEALKGHTDSVISSKVGTRYGRFGASEKDFSNAAIRHDVEQSLQRLRRDRIDILYLHGPNLAQIDTTQDVMARLKQEGKIGKIGICGVGAELAHAVEIGAVDVVMGLYNAFDQRHGKIFRAAKLKNIQTIGIAPLGQALYRRGFTLPKSPADAWYLTRALVKNRAQFKHARGATARRLEAFEPLSPAGAMLNFALSNSDIDLVITNTTRREHLKESVETACNLPLSDAALAKLSMLERHRQSG